MHNQKISLTWLKMLLCREKKKQPVNETTNKLPRNPRAINKIFIRILFSIWLIVLLWLCAHLIRDGDGLMCDDGHWIIIRFGCEYCICVVGWVSSRPWSKCASFESRLHFTAKNDDSVFYCYYRILLHRLSPRAFLWAQDSGNHCLSEKATK